MNETTPGSEVPPITFEPQSIPETEVEVEESTLEQQSNQNEAIDESQYQNFIKMLKNKYQNAKISFAGKINGLFITGVLYEYPWDDEGVEMMGHTKVFYYGEKQLPLFGGIEIMSEGRARSYVEQCIEKGLDPFSRGSLDKIESSSRRDPSSVQKEFQRRSEEVRQELESIEGLSLKLQNLAKKHGEDIVADQIKKLSKK